MELYIFYIKIILIGAAVSFLIKWILAIFITTVTLKLNYQKTLSSSLSVLNSMKIVIIPSIIYVILEMILLVILSISAKLFLSGDARMFFSDFVSSVAFIVAIMVFYFLLKNSLLKHKIENNLAKAIADSAVKYYVLISILIGVVSMIL